MEFRVLGPVEVRVDGEVVPIPALRQRALFALLLIHAGGVLSADRIIEALWGDELPASGANALRFHVSKLRSALGADPSPIVTQDGGYALVVDPGSIDANRFEQLLGESLEEMRDDPHRAAALVGEALELWRGDPYAGLGDPGFVDGEVRRLTELRFKAVEVGFAADLALGRHAEIIGDLESMQAEFPFRERLWAHLMVAFYRSGRQAEALRAYQRASEVLGEELGIEPSEELRELENRILLHDPTLDYAPVIPGNLPSPPGSFIGRESELAEVEELLEANRLVTLTGAGGSGKTRLAAELGQVAKRNWSDGVWFVDLRSIDDPADIPSLVASTMRVVVSGDLPIVDQVADALRSRSLLLILDNCERVLDRTAALTERLLREDGDVRVLATSREPLGVPGEVVHIVTPLPVPGEEGLDDPTGYPSVQLFAARARYVRPGFDVGDHVGAVSRICRAVDGLPLALELAAAQMHTLNPEEIAERLCDQHSLLRVRQRAGDLRHATMESTIRWSWSMLNGDERTFLARLSTFRGTWPLDAADAVCGFGLAGDVGTLDLLRGLVAKSLVTVDEAAGGVTRYRLLEPIRQFAAAELSDFDAQQVEERALAFWIGVLDEPTGFDGRFRHLDRERAKALEPDQANIEATLSQALASRRFEDALSILGSPYGGLLVLQGSQSELVARAVSVGLEQRDVVSRETVMSVLAVALEISMGTVRNEEARVRSDLGAEMATTPEEREWFAFKAAVATIRLGRRAEAMERFDRIAAESDDPGVNTAILIAKSQDASPAEAWKLVERAMDLAPLDQLSWYPEETAAYFVAEAAVAVGRYGLAVEMAERSFVLSRRRGWGPMAGHAGCLVAHTYAELGRLEEAENLLAELLPVVRRILGADYLTSVLHQVAACTLRLQGDLDRARSHIDLALRSGARAKSRSRFKHARGEAGLIARDSGDHEAARRILGEVLQEIEEDASKSPDLSHYEPARCATLAMLASVELRDDGAERALRLLAGVLAEPHALWHSLKAEVVDLAAIALAQKGDVAVAACLLAAIDRESDDTGLVIESPDTPVREAAMQVARDDLADDWEAAVERGRAMTLDEAVEMAADATKPRPGGGGRGFEAC